MKIGEDTIVAVATPSGEGAVALLRLSGPDAVGIADAFFRGKKKPSEVAARFQQLGTIVDGEEVIDSVLLSVFCSPASYTGEDLVEISCHGGVFVTRRILKLLLSRGARLADPGEFTFRAFVNGKMDLTQAEAVMDVIRSGTDLALRAAEAQLRGELGRRVAALRDGLLSALAHLEAYIDFPDEEIDPETGDALAARIRAALDEVATLLGSAGRGRALREGVRTVIFGAPNVGKSSLLNVLLGHERAIVSEQPGTTRDTVEEVIDLRGVPLRLVDTAGLRDSEDRIEREGMRRTRDQIARADLALRVVDASQPPDEGEPAETADAARTLLVLNKADLGVHPGWAGSGGVAVSCTAKSGFDQLEEEIVEALGFGAKASWEAGAAINLRHQAALARARERLEAVLAGMAENRPPEFLSVDLRDALDAVGEISGKVDADELLGKIFATFCIGK